MESDNKSSCIDVKPLSVGFIKMSVNEFNRLGGYIYKEFGIRMGIEKHTMLQARLQKRLKELQMLTFKEYIDYVLSKEGKELEIVEMVNQVSTNKTDFFREAQHFDFLVSDLLPIIKKVKSNSEKQIKIWSAASSSGEEVYTIAMVMSDWCSHNPEYDYSIFGTDISTKVLDMAVNAIYKEDKIYPVKEAYKKKYLLKHKDPTQKIVRVIPELRRRCHFERLNLMDEKYNIKESFDIIFCRNVLIYFDRITQENVINKLCRSLRKGGIFFLGHSESILQMNVPLKQIKPTIFEKI